MEHPAAPAPKGNSNRGDQNTLGPRTLAPAVSRVSIIGTAGRGESRAGLDAAMYARMVAAALEWITTNVPGEVHLVSGGAAWADHVAVTLFLQKRFPRLTLYFPCPLEKGANGDYAYRDTGVKDFKVNPGRTANQYHNEFSAELGKNTLNEINDALKSGAAGHVFPGFHARNTEVARSDYVLALTWAEGAEPAWGGTLDTWTKSRGKKHHISLKTLK